MIKKKKRGFIKKKDGVFYVICNGKKMVLEDIFEASEESMSKVSGTHPEYYFDVSVECANLEHTASLMKLKMDEAKIESDRVLMQISNEIRSGKIDIGIKITEGSVKECSKINKQYQESLKVYYEASKEHLIALRNYDLGKSLLKALEHKKDYLTFYSTIWRSKISQELRNLEQKYHEFNERLEMVENS